MNLHQNGNTKCLLKFVILLFWYGTQLQNWKACLDPLITRPVDNGFTWDLSCICIIWNSKGKPRIHQPNLTYTPWNGLISIWLIWFVQILWFGLIYESSLRYRIHRKGNQTSNPHAIMLPKVQDSFRLFQGI